MKPSRVTRAFVLTVAALSARPAAHLTSRSCLATKHKARAGWSVRNIRHCHRPENQKPQLSKSMTDGAPAKSTAKAMPPAPTRRDHKSTRIVILNLAPFCGDGVRDLLFGRTTQEKADPSPTREDASEFGMTKWNVAPASRRRSVWHHASGKMTPPHSRW